MNSCIEQTNQLQSMLIALQLDKVIVVKHKHASFLHCNLIIDQIMIKSIVTDIFSVD